MTDKTDAAVYSSLIVSGAIIGAGIGYYNNRKENQATKYREVPITAFWGLFIGLIIAIWLDGSDVFEGYKEEEKEKEEVL